MDSCTVQWQKIRRSKSLTSSILVRVLIFLRFVNTLMLVSTASDDLRHVC